MASQSAVQHDACFPTIKTALDSVLDDVKRVVDANSVSELLGCFQRLQEPVVACLQLLRTTRCDDAQKAELETLLKCKNINCTIYNMFSIKRIIG